MESSEYVTKYLKELAFFGQKIDKTIPLPPKVKAGLWEAVILRGIEVIVDSYTKIKKCTSEGRANMLQGILIYLYTLVLLFFNSHKTSMQYRGA